MLADRLTSILQRWLGRGVLLAAGLAVMLGLAVGVIFARDQFFSSSSSVLEGPQQELRQAILEAPDDPDLRVSLADLYLKDGNYADAIAQYQEALRADETRQDALMGLGMAYRGSKPEDVSDTLEPSVRLPWSITLPVCTRI